MSGSTTDIIYTRDWKLQDKFTKHEKGDTAEVRSLKTELEAQHAICLGLLGSFKQTEAELHSLHKVKVRFITKITKSIL